MINKLKDDVKDTSKVEVKEDVHTASDDNNKLAEEIQNEYDK